MLNLNLIEEARERIKNIAVKTPLSYAPNLSAISGAKIYLKKDNLQLTGAFKIRGAFNKIASLSPDERSRGITAASAGNHAQGVAYSANHFNIPATIIMPEATPLTKVNGVKNYGSEVILKGSNYDEAYGYALEYAKENNLTFIHPFADDEIIAGQGTIGLEILEDIADIDIVIVPVGGGGLISGVASAIKHQNPKIKVIGVTAEGAPAMRDSFIAKKPIDSLSVRTIADGIAVRDTSPFTLKYILESVDDIIEVCDEEIASAILFLLEKQKLVVEGAGAVGVAAVLHNKLKIDILGKKVVVLLSGGNIDVTMLSIIIEKGLLKSFRKMKLQVTLIDKPGALTELTEILRDCGANIVQIGYDRTSTSLAYGDANVTIAVETKGESHQDEVRAKLKEYKLKFEEIN